VVEVHQHSHQAAWDHAGTLGARTSIYEKGENGREEKITIVVVAERKRKQRESRPPKTAGERIMCAIRPGGKVTRGTGSALEKKTAAWGRGDWVYIKRQLRDKKLMDDSLQRVGDGQNV